MLRDPGVANVTRAVGAASAIDGIDWIADAPELMLCSAAVSNSDGFGLLASLDRIGYSGPIVLTADLMNIAPAFPFVRFNHLDVVGPLRKPCDPATVDALLAGFA